MHAHSCFSMIGYQEYCFLVVKIQAVRYKLARKANILLASKVYKVLLFKINLKLRYENPSRLSKSLTSHNINFIQDSYLLLY